MTVPAEPAGTSYSFLHDLLPEPQTLHPVRVYSEDYGTLWGYGLALDFSGGSPGTVLFGNGVDGSLSVATGETRVFEFSHDQCDRIRHQRDR